MYKPHVRCRACGYGLKPGAEGIKAGPQTERLISVFDLGVQPLANDFQTVTGERAGFAPLNVLFCPNCTLAQLSVNVRPDVLYATYNYVTSPTEAMRLHFKALMESLFVEPVDLDDACLHDTRILEIGSNDGTFLKYLASKGAQVVGIDPAENLAAIARINGVPTVTGIFDAQRAENVLYDCSKGFDVVFARHVFCHVEDWNEFIRYLALVTKKTGVVVIEVPWVKDLLDKGEFDTIYHEHNSYMSIKAMIALLDHSAFTLVKVQKFPIHGGAISLMLRRIDSSSEIDPSVADFTAQESINLSTWEEFGIRARTRMADLKGFVEDARAEGKTVAGYGASAKSTVWINACGFTRKDIAYIVDETPQKLWKYSPGSDIPIVDEGSILRELPDYVICFAWNWRETVLEKNKLAREKGVKFVFPIPKLEIV